MGSGGAIGRVDVLGTPVSAVDMPSAVAEIARWVEAGERHYVCVTGVHGIMESSRDPELRRIYAAAGLVTPDGMPAVWCAHWAGARHVERVYGPDLMLAVLARAEREGWRSFFYGGKEGVPEALAARLRQRFPRLEVCGTYSPPFRALTDEEKDEVVRRLEDARPHLVWVGLSTPKQERWMAEFRPQLSAPALLGVGAAFDIHAGLLRQAPPWMQRTGLEWAYRLYREPQRLWRRYLRNNPAFVLAVLRRPPRLLDAQD